MDSQGRQALQARPEKVSQEIQALLALQVPRVKKAAQGPLERLQVKPEPRAPPAVPLEKRAPQEPQGPLAVILEPRASQARLGRAVQEIQEIQAEQETQARKAAPGPLAVILDPRAPPASVEPQTALQGRQERLVLPARPALLALRASRVLGKPEPLVKLDPRALRALQVPEKLVPRARQGLREKQGLRA